MDSQISIPSSQQKGAPKSCVKSKAVIGRRETRQRKCIVSGKSLSFGGKTGMYQADYLLRHGQVVAG